MNSLINTEDDALRAIGTLCSLLAGSDDDNGVAAFEFAKTYSADDLSRIHEALSLMSMSIYALKMSKENSS